MNIDIRTFSIVLSITAVFQIVAISMQYLLNKKYKGIGWWLIGYIFIAAGFAVIPLRDFAALEKLSIIATNFLQISGLFAIYTGVKVFFDRKVSRTALIVTALIYMSLIAFFTFINDNISMRIIIYSMTVSVTSFFNIYNLIINRNRSIAVSVNFISFFLFIQGCLFLTRAVVTVIHPVTVSFFIPTPIQVAVFLISLVNINLYMTGFIILINQRLNEDNLEAREHFEIIFNTSPDAAIISRMEDGRIVNANEGFVSLSGMTRNEIEGKGTPDLKKFLSPEDRDRIREELIKRGVCENVEMTFINKDGSQLSGLVSAKMVTLHGIPHVISVARDITLRKKIEDKLIRAVDEVIRQREFAEKATREKELLLREVHHRIKNNMNTIVGLLSIQADTMEEPSAVTALEDAGSRVRSMMMLYDKLYRSEGFTEIPIREYLAPLVDEVCRSFPFSRSITINKEISDFIINAETLFSLGIIVNELLTNIMKYAFQGMDRGEITVTAGFTGDDVIVTIQDNGNGLPESVDINNSTGFGLQLVGMLTKQIHGTIKVERNSGTKFILEFKI